MSTYLRPCVALDRWKPGNNGFYGPQSYASFSNALNYRDSRTPWARFFIRWHYLQPYDGTDPAVDTRPIPGWSGMTPQIYLSQIDECIRRARTDGLGVILCLRDFPLWTNVANRASGPDPHNGSAPYLCPADDVSPASPYALIVQYLANRYHPSRGDSRRIDFLEICNEPNSEWWPQVDHSGTRVLHEIAAQMLLSARAVTSATVDLPVIAGPSLADTSVMTPTQTVWSVFMDGMLSYLALAGFNADAGVVWSHHNYKDVELGLTGAENRAGGARLKLVEFGWAGWPAGDPADPQILLTEGGHRLARGNPGLNAQAAKVEAAWNESFNGSASPGMAMFTNYLFWTDPNFDSGLLNGAIPSAQAPDPALSRRPLYSAWRRLPTRAPR